MLTRRALILTAGAAVVSHLAPARAEGDATFELWPGTPPGGGPTGPIIRSAAGAIHNIAAPSVAVFKPAAPNGIGLLVAAGGGYKRIEMGKEAWPAAHWLNDHGITAFVLSYRLPSEGWNAGPLAPLQDAQRALRLIRANASRYGIDPAKLGVLGFSSGGHLLGLAATRSAFVSYPAQDAADAVSARPDFAALIYPIITLLPPYNRTSTRRVLVGDHPDFATSAEWSVETHVRLHCPPVFLVQAADDPISNPANTAIMQAACERAGVPVERHLLASGGHGFGMGVTGQPSSQWPDFFSAWLARIMNKG